MEEKLSSLDVARYVHGYAMRRYRVALSKTRVNMLLFICFAYYLVLNRSTESPFSDAKSPKAWLFGPIFPRVDRWFDPSDFVVERRVAKGIEKNPLWSCIIPFVVEKYHDHSASELTRWTHRAGSPWHQTVFGADGMGKPTWDCPIGNRLILDYFNAKGA